MFAATDKMVALELLSIFICAEAVLSAVALGGSGGFVRVDRVGSCRGHADEIQSSLSLTDPHENIRRIRDPSAAFAKFLSRPEFFPLEYFSRASSGVGDGHSDDPDACSLFTQVADVNAVVWMAGKPSIVEDDLETCRVSQTFKSPLHSGNTEEAAMAMHGCLWEEIVTPSSTFYNQTSGGAREVPRAIIEKMERTEAIEKLEDETEEEFLSAHTPSRPQTPPPRRRRRRSSLSSPLSQVAAPLSPRKRSRSSSREKSGGSRAAVLQLDDDTVPQFKDDHFAAEPFPQRDDFVFV